MASNINYASIDETYPIAGKDNDSQGFRDNFGYIKNSLEAAKSEIETIQLTTATTDANNDFNNYQISRANFINCGETLHNGNIVSSNTLISYVDGSMQIFSVDSDLTFTLSGFPADGTAGRLRIQLISQSNVSRTVTFAVNAGTIKLNTLFSGYTGSLSQLASANTVNPLTVSSLTNPVVIDFWTYDGGSTVFMNYVGTFV